MRANSLKGSEQSFFLDFTYASSNEPVHISDRPRSSKLAPKWMNGTATTLPPQFSKTELKVRPTSRLSAGKNHQKASTNLKLEPCHTDEVPGIHYKRNADVTQLHLQLNTRSKPFDEDDIRQQNPKKRIQSTRGTQSLYRESSAQTLPYLPEVKNDPKSLEYMEVFKLAKILPGDGPPGLYEVEVLERARKRWEFAEALRENFKNGVNKAREQLNKKQFKTILESFAFEQWIEREEYVMECQMMRLDIVIRMFNQREQKMHANSKQAIELAYHNILKKRDADLKKNDIEFKRALRRLEYNKQRRPRDWRGCNKESLVQQLSDPKSLYHAPQTRFGISPAQRHFSGDVRKLFDIETVDIEKMDIDAKHIQCPFAKLKEWSKPKELTKEIETKFLSDENLQKLYETLKSLRLQSDKNKSQPKCLLRKHFPKNNEDNIENYKPSEGEREDSAIYPVNQELRFYQDSDQSQKQVKSRPVRKSMHKYVSFSSQRTEERRFRRVLFVDRRREDIEAMVASYEGKTIGWILRFLSEEMLRLQELRELHMITILAQRERWRREAAEAGLRQKENDMRELFEQMFETVDQLNSDDCEDFFADIVTPDTHAYADDLATTYVTKLAKQIDEDLNRWLKSFEAIQNPCNFDKLRILLRDMVFPNIEQILYRSEVTKVIHYIINDVLFPKIYKELEPYDISFAISNDFVDRLIDNDLFYFSSECDSECDCRVVCVCPVEQREVKAILRKLVRYAVPGRRWKTPTERVAYENFVDIVDEAFDHSYLAIHNEQETSDEDGCLKLLHKVNSVYDLSKPNENQRLSVSYKERWSSCLNKVDYQAENSLNELRPFPSEYDIHNPRDSAEPPQNTSDPSLHLSETFMNLHKLERYELGDPKTNCYQFMNNILSDVIKTVFTNGSESSILNWVEEENGTLEEIVDYEETLREAEANYAVTPADQITEKLVSYESSYEDISQSELDRMAEDKCKCREEKLKELHLWQQIATGKLRVKKKVQNQYEDELKLQYNSQNNMEAELEEKEISRNDEEHSDTFLETMSSQCDNNEGYEGDTDSELDKVMEDKSNNDIAETFSETKEEHLEVGNYEQENPIDEIVEQSTEEQPINDQSDIGEKKTVALENNKNIDETD